MLDKNGFPLQFPASAFAAFPGLTPGMPGDPRAHVWQHPMTATTTQPNNTSQSNGNQGFAPPINSIESSAMLGLPPNAHSISPNYLNALHHSPTASLRLSAAAAVSGHQEYLNAAAQRLGELQASAGLVDPLHFDASRFAAASRVTRKRALSASPYSEMDLANLIRNSPLNGSASSSGSYGHLSPGTMSPALGFHAANAHLQQLQAHLLRSASSPYLPTSSFLHSSAAALHSPYFPLFTSASSVPTTTTTTSSPSNALANPKMTPEHSSNVVSSTMEDDDSSDTSPRERIKGSKTSSLRVPPSNASTGDKDDVKEEPDFVETHCHWRGCDQEFGTQDDLVKHLNNDHIGTNKKLFICQWQTCSRAEKPFKAQYMLVVHMRRHTGEKPHRCTFESCSKAYSRLENLKTHLRSHTGEKPYVCEFPGCAKAFSNASDRAKHQNRTHSNEKPYACKALGCTKRYTDPSSLRKHVKTVHGADFYASKRHKGESHEDGSSHNPDGDSSGKSRAKHSNQATGQSGIKLENSPLSLSPADVRLPNSNPISHDQPPANSDIGLPISDNNVSTTANDIMSESTNDWDIKETDDINMAVAAAIGVGNGDLNDVGRTSGYDDRLVNRINAKAKASKRVNGSTAVLGEINRSIEKLSIGNVGVNVNGCQATTYPTSNHLGKGTKPGTTKTKHSTTTVLNTEQRRDSNWTSSTEGYGSMRSDHVSALNDSRRCSELSSMSQVSNLSTRAQMNSPWDPISADGSRRSSMRESVSSTIVAPTGLSNQLNRLHQKAQSMTNPSLGATLSQSVNMDSSGRHSAMSDSGVANPNLNPINNYGTPRRASDPVRALDRNFGVRNQMARYKTGSHVDTAPATPAQMLGNFQQHPQPPSMQYNGAQSQVRSQSNPSQSFPAQNYAYPQTDGTYSGPRPQYQTQTPAQAQQWSGYQSGPNYNPTGESPYYNQSQPYNYSQWAGQQSQWNQAWDWNRSSAQVGPNGDSYQRTLEYVQQCQSWNGSTPNQLQLNPNLGHPGHQH